MSSNPVPEGNSQLAALVTELLVVGLQEPSLFIEVPSMVPGEKDHEEPEERLERGRVWHQERGESAEGDQEEDGLWEGSGQGLQAGVAWERHSCWYSSVILVLWNPVVGGLRCEGCEGCGAYVVVKCHSGAGEKWRICAMGAARLRTFNRQRDHDNPAMILML